MQAKTITPRAKFLLLLALSGLAFLVRLVVVWRYFKTTSTMDFWTFGFEPSHIAAALARGLGFSSPFTDNGGPTAWLPPAYPWLIEISFRIFGMFSARALECMLAINIACATLTTAAIYRIGLRCFSAEIAFCGALLWAISPDAVAMSVRIWDIGIASMLGVLVVLWYLRIVQSEARTIDWVIYALLWGVSALTTTTLLAMMPLALLVLFFHGRGKYRRQAVFAGAIVILAMVPWTIRNYRQLGHLIPIRGNFGAELWMGNHPGVQGPADESMHPLKNPQELSDYLSMGEPTYVATRQRMAKEFIRQNPGLFAKLTVERFISFWAAPLVMTSGWPIGCSVLAWVSTIFLLWRRESRLIAVPFAAAMIFFPLSYYISHAESYYRSPIEPLISLLAAYAVFTCLDMISHRGAAGAAQAG